MDQVPKVGALEESDYFHILLPRDITPESVDTFFLGPIVATQRIIT